MDYICYAIHKMTQNSYPKEYLIYYSLFSRMTSKLLAPIFSDAQVENLYKIVVEMICIHEALFPVSQCKMVFHQLVDLPGFIKKFGPVRGWWTLPAERGIAVIKRNLTEGNYHMYYKRVFQREYIKEFIQANETYSSKEKLYRKSFTITEDKVASFSDFKIELLCNSKQKDTYYASEFQFKQYVTFLVETIENLDVGFSAKVLNSPIYRMYLFFNANKKQFTLEDTGSNKHFQSNQFYEFLKHAINIKNLPIIQGGDLNEITDVEYEQIISGNFIMEKDLQYVSTLLSTEHEIYMKAVIWGVEFQGRGQQYCEISLPSKTYRYGIQREHAELIPSNNLNVLKKPKNIKALSVSSMCLINLQPNLYLCHINFFSKINAPGEIYLHGIPYAFVTSWDCSIISITQDSKYSNLYSSKLSYLSSPYYVQLRNIYPCPVAAVPMDENDKPLCHNEITKMESILFFLLNRNRVCVIDTEDNEYN